MGRVSSRENENEKGRERERARVRVCVDKEFRSRFVKVAPWRFV